MEEGRNRRARGNFLGVSYLLHCAFKSNFEEGELITLETGAGASSGGRPEIAG